VEGLNRPLYEELLKPTKIYVKTILDLLDRFKIKGMAHITGGGLPGNIKRIIPNGLCAHLNLNNNRIPDIFNVLRKLGNIPLGDMLATFNMGIGFIVIVSADDAQDILNTIMSSGEQGFIAGIIEKSWDDQKVRIDFI